MSTEENNELDSFEDHINDHLLSLHNNGININKNIAKLDS